MAAIPSRAISVEAIISAGVRLGTMRRSLHALTPPTSTPFKPASTSQPMLVQRECGWRDMHDASYYRGQAERARRLARVTTDRATAEALVATTPASRVCAIALVPDWSPVPDGLGGRLSIARRRLSAVDSR